MDEPSIRRALAWTLVAAVAIVIGSALPMLGVDSYALAAATGQPDSFRLPMLSMLGQAPATLVIVQSALLIGGWTQHTGARIAALGIYLALTAMSALGIAFWLETLEYGMVVSEPGWAFRILVVVSSVAFAAVLWWIGDRISQTSGAHGALAIALADAVFRAPFAAWDACAAWALGVGSLVEVIGALLPGLAVLALGILVVVRPAKWPVALTKRFSLRSWIDLAGIPLAVRVLLSQPLAISLAGLAAFQGDVLAWAVPVGTLAATIAVAAIYVAKVPRGEAEKSFAPSIVGALVVVLSLGTAMVAFHANDGYAMFAPGPLAGEASFRFTLAAERGSFGSDEAEAMVERIEQLGARATIVSQSAERITLSVEEASDRDSVLDAIRPQQLELRIVTATPAVGALPEGASRDYGETIAGPCQVIEPFARTLACDAAVERQVEDDGSERCAVICLADEVVLDNAGIEEASVATDPAYGEPYVAVTLTDAAAQRFGEVTSANIGNRLAILVNGEVMSAPVIRSAITGGSVQITLGRMRDYNTTMREASILATALSSASASGGGIRTPWMLESEG